MSYYNPIWRRRSSSGGGGPPPPGGLITIHPYIYENVRPTNSATCRMTFQADGWVTGHGPNADYQWLTGGDPAAFDLVATHFGGNPPTGSLNAPVTLGADRSYSIQVGYPSSDFSMFAVTITERANPANKVGPVAIQLNVTAEGSGGPGGGIDIPI